MSLKPSSAMIPDYLADYYDAAETDVHPPHLLEAFRMRGVMIHEGAKERVALLARIAALESTLAASRDHARDLQAQFTAQMAGR